MDQKHVKLQIVDYHNKVLEESEVVLNDGDVLVAQVPKGTNLQQAQELMKGLKKSLSGELEVISIQETVKLLVIKKS